jgi:hypothetical protein
MTIIKLMRLTKEFRSILLSKFLYLYLLNFIIEADEVFRNRKSS